jgi:hypothetical protein
MTNTHVGFKIIYVVGGMWSLCFNYIAIQQSEKQLKLLNDISKRMNS